MAASGQGTMSVSEEGNHPLLPSPTGLLPLGWLFHLAIHLKVGFRHFVT